MTYTAGLIGYGYWGTVLLNNFNAHVDIKVKTICDRNSSKLKKALAAFPASHVCQDTNNIFTDPDIDFVIIATQGNSHHSLVRKALLSNKHVFVEKPFTINSEQAKDLISINKDCNLSIMVDHTFLFAPQYEVIKKILTEKKIGKILHYFSLRADFGKFQTDINIFWHLMYHDIYMLLDLFGKEMKPKSIKASGTCHITPFKEDTAVVSIIYPNGFNADIINNMLSPQKERKLIIVGERGIIEWDDMAPEKEKLKLFNSYANYNNISKRIEYSQERFHKILEVPTNTALESAINHFIFCLKENSKPISNENAAYKTIEFVQSIQDSSSE